MTLATDPETNKKIVRTFVERVQGAGDIHQLADGDLVATYKTFNGTHQGEFFGVPPTGRHVSMRVMDFVRIRDGKIAEHWNVVDVAGLMQQLGVG